MGGVVALLGALVAVVLDVQPARAARPGPAGPPRFAIVIGNNQPEEARASVLRYADDDAVSTHALLVEAGVDSVLLARPDADTRRMHPDVVPLGPPRGEVLDAAVGAIFERVRAAAERGDRPELLIFYSGHGDVAGGEGYVVLEDRRLTRSDLYDLLSRSPAARHHVFVDACKSYFFAFEKGPGGQRTSVTGAFLDRSQPGQLDNVGFVLSTSSDRDSHEWERFEAGILSYELRSALRGGADADRDGRVTYAELGAFLASANQAIANPRFRPDFLVRPPGRNVRQEVLRWTGEASTIHLGLAGDAHVYLEDSRGERIADVHPAAHQPITLHVPSARPLFVRKSDESAEVVVAGQATATIAALEPRPPAIARKGALNLAFEQLFADAFDGRDVDSFVAIRLDEPAVPPPEPLHPALGRAAGAASLTAAVAGVALSAVALQRYEAAAGASQRDIDAANQTVHKLNVASLVCYGVAALFGATWGWLRWSD